MFRVIAIILLATTSTWAVPIEEQHAKPDPSVIHIQPRGTEQIVGNKLLAVGPFKATWFEAEQFCKFGGKTLATVITNMDLYNLVNYLNIYGSETDAMYYLDANNLSGGPYTWVSTGLRVQQKFLMRPDVQSKSGCLRIASNATFTPYLEEGDCFEKNYFVCQKILSD